MVPSEVGYVPSGHIKEMLIRAKAVDVNHSHKITI